MRHKTSELYEEYTPTTLGRKITSNAVPGAVLSALLGGALGYDQKQPIAGALGGAALGGALGAAHGVFQHYTSDDPELLKLKEKLEKDNMPHRFLKQAELDALAKFAGVKEAAPWTQMAGQALRNLGPSASQGAKGLMGAAKTWGGQVARAGMRANQAGGLVAGANPGMKGIGLGALQAAKTFAGSRAGKQALGAGALGAGAMYGGYKMMQPSKPPQQG